MSVNFPGFSGMVDALGGITMDFPTAVKDQYTGLDVTTTGCQVVNGTTALQLVRSRHLYYMNSNGYWEGDGLSDFSRIQRQDAFFRAVLAKLNASIPNPLTINSFIGAAVSNMTIDDTLSQERPLQHRPGLQGPALLAPGHRDAAHPRLHDRRRRGRAEGGPALRQEHDQRLQPDRDGAPPTRHDDAGREHGQGRHDHHDDADRPTARST